jgi:hypothetical protein
VAGIEIKKRQAARVSARSDIDFLHVRISKNYKNEIS